MLDELLEALIATPGLAYFVGISIGGVVLGGVYVAHRLAEFIQAHKPRRSK